MLINRTEQKLSKWAWGLHFGGLAVTSAVCFIMLTAVILPLRLQHREVIVQEEEFNEILKLEESVTKENERLTAVLSEADQKIRSLLDRIPNVARESDFLGQITTLAQEVDVEIMDYTPGSIAKNAEYHEMNLTLTSQGSYEGVCDFLHRLHSLPRLCRANKMSILPIMDGRRCSLNMTLTIYYSPNSKLASGERDNNNG